MRVLLVEDDVMFGSALVGGLRDNGMTVDWIQDGQDGLAVIESRSHTLVLLDLGLPTLSGFAVLKATRANGGTMPVLIITAKEGVETTVKGLDLGADDYIVKPFSLNALLARMRAVLRRSSGQAQSLIVSGEISLDLATHVAIFRTVKDTLSAREFSLLYALMKRPGSILTRSQIEDCIYGWGEEVQSNAVDVLIHGLRKRFGKDIIRNIRGAGWLVTKDRG